MPCDARPQARSLKGLLGPMVSSWSLGPEPCTSTTAGKGPSPAGMLSVPGSAHSPLPTVTSLSVNYPDRHKVARYRLPEPVVNLGGFEEQATDLPFLVEDHLDDDGGFFELGGHVDAGVVLHLLRACVELLLVSARLPEELLPDLLQRRGWGSFEHGIIEASRGGFILAGGELVDELLRQQEKVGFGRRGGGCCLRCRRGSAGGLRSAGAEVGASTAGGGVVWLAQPARRRNRPKTGSS